MNRIQLEDLHAKNLHVYVEDIADAKAVRLYFKGMLYIEDPAREFLPYLRALQNGVVREGLDEVLIDLAGLELMNSSSLRILISFLSDVDSLKAEQQYRIRIRYNPKITWQAAQIPMLSKLRPEFIQLETI